VSVPHPVDGVRVAQVLVDSSVVTLSFQGDLTPVEAVAAFLRDVADSALTHELLLHDLTDQLDPPYLDPAAPTAENGARP
jgi:hypothetical protein